MSQVSLALSDAIASEAPTPRTPRTTRDHLTVLQRTAARFRRHFNAHRVAYRDWHAKKSASFIEALKRIQCLACSRAAPDVTSVAAFRDLRAQAVDLRRRPSASAAGAAAAAENLDRVDEFLNHWRDYLALRETFETALARPLARLLSGTDAFRYPAMKADLLRLMNQLDRESDESFDFGGLHNPTDNLFTYRMALRDERFLGLMQILPRLLQTAAQVCYFTEQLVCNEVEADQPAGNGVPSTSRNRRY